MNRLAVPNRIEGPSWKLGHHDAARLFRLLATLYQTGIPIEVAVASLATETVFFPLTRVARGLREGRTIHDSFQDAGLNNVVILSLLLLGERTGQMDRSLYSLAQLYEAQDKLNKELLSKLTYPLILAGSCCALLCVGPLYLARPILELLEQSGQKVGLLTNLLSLILEIVTSPQFCFGAVASLVFLTAWLPIRWRKAKLPEHILLKVPVVGELLRTLYSARLGRALLACHQAGYPLLSSVGIAARCTGSGRVNREARAVCRALIHGEDESCWRLFTTLQPILLTSIAVGYDTGTLDRVLTSIVNLLEASVQARLERLLALLEPLLLTFMGGMVGFCILATASPMLELLKGLA